MKIDDKIVIQHGLTLKEFSLIKKMLKRDPNLLELGIFSAMWNEHCSYKSSRLHLKKLPTKNKFVIQGPGENAGVIDIGDNDAIVFKIESHNHPSYIEPYQGAATGVGGILRDVFTMGARPMALLNSIHFGDPNNKKTKALLNGVVSGIGGYGNCIGVPTVAGETKFNRTYNENILVNAMAVGHANSEKIFYAKAKGLNKPVVYVGSKTGRDGIHGASMASAEFDENSEEKKPTVQVGDPFTEKLLMEACLELMKDKSIIAIQDMGAAGLTSSSVEMAFKGDLGIEIDLNKVPCREDKMTPYEMMLSESQERMLIILEEDKQEHAKKIFEKWDLDFVVIGKTTNSKNLILKFNHKEVANIPINFLSSEAPKYERAWKRKTLPKKDSNSKKLKNLKIESALIQILSTSNYSNKSWITEQFDKMVMGDTLQDSSIDATIVRIHRKNKAIAVTVDSSANYCQAHPLTGGKQIICENWRNLISAGSTPLAITNCLNFGNPEDPKVMGEFAETIEGMKEACEFLDFPVVSGNVSFYNGTNKKNIFPTPVIGGVGLVKDLTKTRNHKFKKIGNSVFLIGQTFGHLHQSAFNLEILKNFNGPPPEVNLFNEKNNGLAMLKIIDSCLAESIHDVSSGGSLLSICEMALGTNLGINLLKPKKFLNLFEYFFGEDQSRYIIEVNDNNLNQVLKILKNNNIHYEKIGIIQKEFIELKDEFKINIKDLSKMNDMWYSNYNALATRRN